MFKIYSRVYFEKQKLIFFFLQKSYFFKLLLVANIKKKYFIHTNISPEKEIMIKARYMTDVRENYTGKKNIRFIHIVCV